MIAEFVVRSRNFNFWHMARSAVARCRFASARCGLAAIVAGEALGVIARIDSVDFLMRIMTSRATDTLIVCVVALTVGQAVGLETHAQDTETPGGCNLFPGAMALSAEVGGLFRAQSAETVHVSQFRVAALKALQMIFRRAVAAFALHAGDKFIEGKLPVRHGVCRMATEALESFIVTH
jgi:hypothetical protein